MSREDVALGGDSDVARAWLGRLCPRIKNQLLANRVLL